MIIHEEQFIRSDPAGCAFHPRHEESSGELAVESGNNIGTVLLHRGKILRTFLPIRAIGDLLVDDGLITGSELIETLKNQKRNEYVPLGRLLLTMGKVTIEVIEMMAQEQIRHAMKEFQSWTDVNLSFTYKDMKPFDRINLGVHEFLPKETIEVLKTFLTAAMFQCRPRLLIIPGSFCSGMRADLS